MQVIDKIDFNKIEAGNGQGGFKASFDTALESQNITLRTGWTAEQVSNPLFAQNDPLPAQSDPLPTKGSLWESSILNSRNAASDYDKYFTSDNISHMSSFEIDAKAALEVYIDNVNDSRDKATASPEVSPDIIKDIIRGMMVAGVFFAKQDQLMEFKNISEDFAKGLQKSIDPDWTYDGTTRSLDAAWGSTTNKLTMDAYIRNLQPVRDFNIFTRDHEKHIRQFKIAKAALDVLSMENANFREARASLSSGKAP
jgi:hypothetical protein